MQSPSNTHGYRLGEKPKRRFQKRRFQISLQRLFISVAMFAVLFGAGAPCIRADGLMRVLGAFFVTVSICFPLGFAIAGWNGASVGCGFAVVAFAATVLGFSFLGPPGAIIAFVLVALYSLPSLIKEAMREHTELEFQAAMREYAEQGNYAPEVPPAIDDAEDAK